MNAFIKRNFLSILSLLILVGWYVYCVNWDIQNNKKLYQSDLSYYEEQCKKNEDQCANKPSYHHMDTIGQMFYTIHTSSFNKMILIFIVFVTIPGLYQFYKEYHSGFIKNVLVREKYAKYMKKKVIQALKSTIWIVPVFFLLSFIITFIMCDGIVDLNYTLSQEVFKWIPLPDLIYLKNTALFCFVFVLNFILLTISCLFIGFVCIKKSKNFVLANLAALLAYMLLHIVCNVGVGIFLLGKVFHIKGADYYTNIYNLISYNAPIGNETILGLVYTTIFSIVLVIGSYILFKIQYFNKEKVLIEIDK